MAKPRRLAIKLFAHRSLPDAVRGYTLSDSLMVL